MKALDKLQKSYPPITDEDARVVASLIEGIANEGQQKAFVKLLLYQLCDMDGDLFSDDERKTAFALGRRHVGLQLLRIASTTKG